ncbi:hypothetical protein [Yoonia sp.]
MIDVEKNRQKLARLEAHVAWVQQNLGDGPAAALSYNGPEKQ